MLAPKKCCFLFFDYVDYDVFLNARIFYRLAGFQLVDISRISECSLLVYFRGRPPSIFSDFAGEVHFYDYVREHCIDLHEYFPRASSIRLISLSNPNDNDCSYRYIHGYLPVFPSLWRLSLPFFRRSMLPIHVSNYKPLKDDSYQRELISRIKAGNIRVYGAKWDRVQIATHSLSYLAANLKLSTAYLCYGLMYPYQRGQSLSGRMWQAPIQGCIVISETNTNLFACPGVIEVTTFDSLPFLNNISPERLSKEAADFWLAKTVSLANSIDLFLDFKRLPFEIHAARLLLLRQHCDFVWNQRCVARIQKLNHHITRLVRSGVKRFLHYLS